MNIEQALKGDYSFYKDPEMMLESYKEFGFHVERDFFTHEYCDFITSEANQLAAARSNNFKPAIMPHKENEVFLDAMKYAKTVEILHTLVNGVPVGMQTQFFYCKPGTRGFSLHQDNFYIEADDNAFVSVWVSLVDTSISNGGLYIYPGSHKEGKLPVKRLDLSLDPHQDRNANNEETVVPEKYHSYNLTLSKGDALFIHSCLPHGSHSNVSENFRYSLLNLYIREGERFRSGNSARREPIALI